MGLWLFLICCSIFCYKSIFTQAAAATAFTIMAKKFVQLLGLDRIRFLSDGVFAIVITLIVLEMKGTTTKNA